MRSRGAAQPPAPPLCRCLQVALLNLGICHQSKVCERMGEGRQVLLRAVLAEELHQAWDAHSRRELRSWGRWGQKAKPAAICGSRILTASKFFLHAVCWGCSTVCRLCSSAGAALCCWEQRLGAPPGRVSAAHAATALLLQGLATKFKRH